MYKVNDHVILANAGMEVTGKVVGTYTTIRHKNILNGYVVELDPKYRGSIVTVAGDSHAFVSQVVVDASSMRLADPYHHDDDGG